MGSTTVRISETAREALRQMAEQTGEPMQQVLERIIEDYRRRHFFEQVNAAYARLREDEEEWQAEIEERRLVEGTLTDGMDEE